MTKNEFIQTLKESLGNIPKGEKNDILYDYEEHFQIGFQNGKTEEEISSQLGNPRVIAKSYTASATVERAVENSTSKNVWKAVFAAITLSFFNLIVVLGPFIALIGVLISLYAASFAMVAAGFCSIFGIMLMPFTNTNMVVGIPPVAGIFLGIGVACLGLLFFIGNCYLTRQFYKLTARYLKWNIQVVRK